MLMLENCFLLGILTEIYLSC